MGNLLQTNMCFELRILKKKKNYPNDQFGQKLKTANLGKIKRANLGKLIVSCRKNGIIAKGHKIACSFAS